MQTIAIVKETEGKVATVETERTSACEGCHKMAENGGDGCAVCSLMGSGSKITAKAKNEIGAEVGDLVTVESATSKVLFYASLVFLVPLIVAVVAWGVAFLFTKSALCAGLSMMVGFVGTFLVLRIYSNAVRKRECDVEIMEIICKKDGGNSAPQE